ncbi:MAG TPA: prepilin peptidase [Candidatus Enterocloster faecavium]|uniref:Prepilin peptidase n=1 Tax=Candidatus Enterocloster faecavium TaxID=2838560 RepID=A0A9D2RN18_9FIRM|nr:prepilin peptidase [Candidatus Enterocloster faecavium]
MYEKGAAAIFLAAVFWWDVRKRKIPNKLLAAGAAAGAFFLAADGLEGQGPKEALELLASGFGVGMLVLFAGFWLWAARMIGAGDVKLAAVLAGWLGPGLGGKGIGLGMVLGAVWSLGKLIRQGNVLGPFLQLAAYGRECIREKKWKPYGRWKRDGQKAVIPLGACMALGTAIAAALPVFREILYKI